MKKINPMRVLRGRKGQADRQKVARERKEFLKIRRSFRVAEEQDGRVQVENIQNIHWQWELIGMLEEAKENALLSKIGRLISRHMTLSLAEFKQKLDMINSRLDGTFPEEQLKKENEARERLERINKEIEEASRKLEEAKKEEASIQKHFLSGPRKGVIEPKEPPEIPIRPSLREAEGESKSESPVKE